MKNKQLSFIVALFSFCFANGQQYNKVNERTKKVIDSTFNALINKHKIVGMSIAIVDNGEIVYSAGYGFADRENNIAASDKTIYRIGSCTKSFTSLSLLQLQEKEKLKIDHSVKEYLPELKIHSRFNDNNPFYLKDMMCHVSGLPCDMLNGIFGEAPPDINWVIEQLNKQTTIAPARYRHAYSNLSYGLLGEVVARQGKMTYSNYLEKNIFAPLEMNSSFVEPEEKLTKDVSKGYFMNKLYNEPLIRDVGAGLIHSSAIDMAHYLLMYLNNGSYDGKQIISPASVEEMEEDHTKDVELSTTANYGYGLYNRKFWVKSEKDSIVMSIIGHSGGTIVFRSDFRFIPSLNVGIVVLTNTDNGSRIIYGDNKYSLLNIYLKAAKGKMINSNFVEAMDTKPKTDGERVAESKEIMGQYNLGSVLVNVKNTKKITARYGPARFLVKPKKSNPGRYAGRVFLLGFIPVKKLEEEFTFVRLNGETYLKQISARNTKGEYAAINAKPSPIPKTWKEKFGNYEITGPNYNPTSGSVLVSEGMTLKISEEKGYIVIKTKGKTEDLKEKYYLDVISDNLAVIGGIGEDSGTTVRILDNGNIYYQGFEFVRKK